MQKNQPAAGGKNNGTGKSSSKRTANETEGENMEEPNFEWALKEMKIGRKLRRSGWNGKGLWVALQRADRDEANTLPYIYIQYPVGHPAYPNGSRVPWVASQTDLLATDWDLAE